MRLQGGVVADDSDVRERPAQLRSRSMSSETGSRYFPLYMAEALAWLIPESDTGLVEVQAQGRAPKWYLFLQEVEPLPRGCRLRGQESRQKRVRFCIPPFNRKQTHGPKTGAALRTPKWDQAWG